MNDALTSPEKRLNSDVDLAAIRRLPHRAQGLFPSHLGVLSGFSRHFLCPSHEESPRHRVRLDGRFFPASAFAAVV
jgi:hypothetical protein